MSMDSLLAKATTKDDSPIPGYVYVELSKITHSDMLAGEKMAEWLVEKLKKPDSAIKWKVLNVMKNVSKTGRQEFKRSLQRHADAIKACLSFKAPLDPLRGDEPGRRVREAAKEALEAIFDNSSHSSAATAAVGSRITSYSSSIAPATGAAASVYPPTTGFPAAHKPIFGDTTSMLHSPPITTGTMDSMSSYDPRAEKTSGTFLGGLGDKLKSAFTTAPPPTNPGMGSPAPDYNFASNRPGAPYGGPVYSGSAAVTTSTSSPYPPVGDMGASSRVAGVPGGSWGAVNAAAARAVPTVTGTIGRVGGASTDGRYERNLIEELTAPGGVRPVPDKDKLASFLAAVRTLDTSLISRIFDERLAMALPGNDTTGNGSSIALKSIAAIEAICNTAGLETVKKHFADHCDLLLDLVESSDKTNVKVAASRALLSLGVEHDTAPGVSATHSGTSTPATSGFGAPASSGGELDLLGLGGSLAPAPAPATASSDVFGGLTLGGSTAPQSQSNMFAGLSTAAPAFAPAPAVVPAPAPAPAAAGISDIFGGLSLGGNSTVTAPAPASTGMSFPATTVQAPSLLSALSAGSPAPAPAPLFAGLTPAPSPAPAMLGSSAPMSGFAPAGPTAMLNQQLMMVQQQIQAITMQLSSPAGASMQAVLFPQLMALQQQQQQLLTALTSSMATSGSAPMFPLGGPTLGSQLPLNGGGIGRPMGPATTLSPAPAPAPAAPKAIDVFDFVGNEFK